MVDFKEVQKVLMRQDFFDGSLMDQYRPDFEASDKDGNGELDLAEFEHLPHVVMKGAKDQPGRDDNGASYSDGDEGQADATDVTAAGSRSEKAQRKATQKLARELFEKTDKAGNGLVSSEEVQKFLVETRDTAASQRGRSTGRTSTRAITMATGS